MKYVDNRTCCVESCSNTTRNCDLMFCLVPRNPIRAEKWLTSLKLKPNLPKKKFFCSDHFEAKSFSSTLKNRLSSHAVPTLQHKIPTDESITWEKCMESHFVWNSMNSMPNTNSSKDAESNSEDMCVIASLYVASDDCKKVGNGDQNEAKPTFPRYVGRSYDGREEQKALEKTINEYLKKRYLIDSPEEDRNSTNQTKNCNSSVSQQSHKENCASNKQVPIEKNIKINPQPSNSFNNAKRNQVQPRNGETLFCNQQNLIPGVNNSDANNTQPLEVRTVSSHQQNCVPTASATCVVHPPSNESTQTNKRQRIQVNSFATNNNQPLEVETLSSRQQSFSPPASATCVTHPPSNESTQTINKRQRIQVNSFATNNNQPLEVETLSSRQQNFSPPASAISSPSVSDKSDCSSANETPNSLNKSQFPETSQLLPVKIEVNALETDADCDMFAARIAEELKKMKNPFRRVKTHFNIEKILIEAKCGAYDV